jgi:Arc/MetJ family transcription regulator
MEEIMQMTVEIDDALLEKVLAIVGPMEPVPLIHQALTALMQAEAARQLGLLGGTQHQLKQITRRRIGPA